MLTKKMHNKRLASLVLIVFNCMIAQSQSQCRYHDSIFATATSVNSVVYGKNINFADTVDLVMSIYRPDGDTQINRPAILLIHGGGFNTGNYVDPRVLEMCRLFAIRGYVAASIEYRLYTEDPINYAAANYKAMQDAKAAIRFMRGNAATYGVDAQKIFIHGFSAGAFISNHAGYWDYDEVPDSLKTAYGDFEASGNPGIADTVSGVMGWAGGIFDTTWLNNETVPWGSVHNTSDPLVDFWGSNGNYGSGSINQYRQNHLLPSSLRIVDIPGMHTPDMGTTEYNIFSSHSIDFFYDQLHTGCIVMHVSVADGNWSDPAIWLGGVVPAATDRVTVRHNVFVTTNSTCYSLRVEQPAGNVIIGSGVNLIVTN
ncbi:MAG: alpha/beta hydrolase [Ferruginibacter sp.]